ncbi:MAG: APC family permease [Deltaproteobacteria bacterium]|nr:APC family permease [Deltaproteobacteria bacterium]
MAGSMLGIGIFLAPPIVARHVDSSWLFIAIWLFGGLTALGGAVACGELAALFPQNGGDYVFQRKAFGPSVAFASGWVLLGAVFAGSIAAISAGLCTFQLPVLLGVESARLTSPLFELGPLHPSAAQLAAIGLVLVLTAVNALGARMSAGLQAAATLLPIILLVAGVVWALGFAEPASVSEVAPPAGGVTLAGLVAAYLPIYFAYSGWNGVIYMSGEVREPRRIIPRSLLIGTLVVTGLYALLCLGFLDLLGLDGLRGTGEAGSASARAAAGSTAELLVTACVAVALLASLNGSVLGSSRVAFAMARGGAFWARAGKLDARHVPGWALWLQAGWVSVLVLSESFEQILELVSMAMVICGSLTVGALFVLRMRQPQLVRPYRAWGYPVLPAIYLASNAVVIVVMVGRIFTFEPDALYPLMGLGIMLITYALHRFRLQSQA